MTTLSRRGFLKGAVALGAGAVLYRYAGGGWKIVTAAPGTETRTLRLVHTNDHHSRIEPAPNVTIARVGTANVTRNLGGVARRKTLFDAVRADVVGTQDKLFLDAGDVFQGTLYFNAYNGKADRFFYNRLGYAAQAIGNHEFDKGDQVLADYISGAPIAAGQTPEPTAFPLVASNMSAAAGSPLAALYMEEISITASALAAGTPVGKWCKRVIVTMLSGEKVGIVGLTTVETTNIASPSAAITFDPNYANVVNAQAVLLRAAGCNTVIALTHIGFQADIALAPLLTGVNIIVGGHSHTPLLPNPDPVGSPQPFGATRVDVYPKVIVGDDGKSVVVVQDWEWGKWIGDLVIGFDALGEVTAVSSGVIKPVWADGLASGSNPPRALIPGEGAEIVADIPFQSAITGTFKPAIDALGNTVIGTNTAALSNSNVRARETALGNFLADAIRSTVSKFADNTPNIPLVAILNGGGIRTSLDVGPITVGEILQIMPFGNTVGRVTVTGAQLKAALENGVSALQPGAAVDASRNIVGSGRFPNVSGLKYTVDISKPAAQPALAATASAPALLARPGQRITSVQVLEGTTYVPLVLTEPYRVATLSFVINGGDGYSVFRTSGDLADPSVGGGTGQIDSGLIDADAVQEYIKAQPNATINPLVEERIKVIQTTIVRLPLIGNRAPAATPVVVNGD